MKPGETGWFPISICWCHRKQKILRTLRPLCASAILLHTTKKYKKQPLHGPPSINPALSKLIIALFSPFPPVTHHNPLPYSVSWTKNDGDNFIIHPQSRSKTFQTPTRHRPPYAFGPHLPKSSHLGLRSSTGGPVLSASRIYAALLPPRNAKVIICQLAQQPLSAQNLNEPSAFGYSRLNRTSVF